MASRLKFVCDPLPKDEAMLRRKAVELLAKRHNLVPGDSIVVCDKIFEYSDLKEDIDKERKRAAGEWEKLANTTMGSATTVAWCSTASTADTQMFVRTVYNPKTGKEEKRAFRTKEEALDAEETGLWAYIRDQERRYNKEYGWRPEEIKQFDNGTSRYIDARREASIRMKKKAADKAAIVDMAVQLQQMLAQQKMLEKHERAKAMFNPYTKSIVDLQEDVKNTGEVLNKVVKEIDDIEDYCKIFAEFNEKRAA